MTQRERTLAVTLGAVLIAVGGFFLFDLLYWKPYRNLSAQIADRDKQIAKREEEIKAQQTFADTVVALSPRLDQWQKLSLPEGPRSPEAFKRHLSDVHTMYQQFLKDLLDKSGFKARSVQTAAPDSRTPPQLAKNKPAYILFSFTVEGEGDLASVVNVFEGLYRAPLLHQVRSFQIGTRPTSGNGLLGVKMTIEAILVTGAEDIKKRGGVFPKFEGTGPKGAPVVLAPSDRRYQQIATQNMFVPRRIITGKTPTPPPPREDPDDVLRYTRLTFIADSDYYGVWEAQVHNLGTRDGDWHDYAILSAKPPPKDSRYQQAKDQWEKLRKEFGEAAGPAPAAPVQSWSVKDRFNNSVLDFKVLRVEPFRIIIQANDKFYSVVIGDTLKDALAAPMERDQLMALGLTSDPQAVLQQIKLTDLKFSTARKGFEATLVYPDNKNEKKVLATSMIAEEWEAPDSWAVKDSFNAEVVKLKAVKVEEKRLVFLADKKYYAIKPNESLADAMKAPLSEEEVKALGLKAP